MSLQQKALSAVKWNLLSTVVNTGLSILLLWSLSHILTVDQYGIISAALIVSNFCGMLLDFGISNSVIRSKDINSQELSSLYVINIVIGVVVFLLVIIFSNEIAGLFKAGDQLVEQIRIISFGFLFLSFGLQPRALMTRNMYFDNLAKIMIITTIVNFVVSLSLALIYHQVWCVAVAYLVSNFINVIYTNYLARRTLSYFYKFSFTLSSVKNHIKYGIQLVMDSFINQVSINTYPVLMSRLISISAIGGYNISYSISIALFEKLNPVLSHALFPALSKISDNEEKLSSTFLKVTSFSALVNFPILLGMFLISDELIHLVFDPKWFFIIPIVKILCITGAIRSLDTPVISILLVKAQMYRNVYAGTIKLVVGIPMAWFLGLKFGIIGIVSSFLIIQALNTFAGYFMLIKPVINVSFSGYLKAILLPLIHVLPMVISVFIFKSVLISDSDLINLVFFISLGCLVYLASVFLSPSALIKDFREVVIGNFLKRINK